MSGRSQAQPRHPTPIAAAPTTDEREQPVRPVFGFWNYVWISIYWFGISYLWGGINGIILPLLNAQLVEEQIKGVSLGIITALGMVVAIVVQPTSGALSDISRHRWGRRRPFILTGGTLTLFALFFLAVVATFWGAWWLLLVGYLLLQFSENIAQGAYQGFIPDMVPENRRGTASGAMAIAQTLGNIGGVGGASVLASFGIQWAILVAVPVLLLSLYPTLFLVREEPNSAPPEKFNRFNVVMDTLKELREYPDFVRLLVSRLFILTALATLTEFALYFLQDVLGITDVRESTSLVFALGVVIICSLIAIFPAAWLSDRIGRKRMIILACIIGFVGVSLLTTVNSIEQFVLFASIIGLSLGAFNSVDWAFATDLIPREKAGRFMGISNLANAGSQALAGLLGGILRDSFNAIGRNAFGNPTLGYRAIFVAAALYFVVGIYFLMRIKEPPHESRF